MSTLDQAEKVVLNLTRSDKVQLLHRLVRDLGETFPGIDKRPDVCGGDACIVRTRIPVWLLEQARRLGAGEIDLLRSYPTLRASDLANAWEYVRAHPDELISKSRKTRRPENDGASLRRRKLPSSCR